MPLAGALGSTLLRPRLSSATTFVSLVLLLLRMRRLERSVRTESILVGFGVGTESALAFSSYAWARMKALETDARADSSLLFDQATVHWLCCLKEMTCECCSIVPICSPFAASLSSS